MVLDFFTKIFRPHVAIPESYRSNFVHLFGDIGWFGVLNGSTIAFMAVYAARLGATGDQIGLLGAMSALANLVFTLPIGILLSKRSISRAVVWSAILNRVFYIVFIIIPIALAPQKQVWVMIATTLVMSIPMTGVQVGFNALFAEAVPVDWRGYVASVRNALVSFASMVTTLVCGSILESTTLATGYLIVFSIGFIGSGLSTYHLAKIQPTEKFEQLPAVVQPVHKGLINQFRFDILKTDFRTVVLLFFFFHFFQYIVMPINPVYVVNILGYRDQIIGLGMSMFQVMVFFTSMRVFQLTRSRSNKVIVGVGMVLMAEYPAMLPFSQQTWVYLLVVTLSGVGWGIVSAVMFNYLLDRMPNDQRPAHMSWYNMALNAAILLASLIGPAVAGSIGYDLALWLFGVGRACVGLALLRWG